MKMESPTGLITARSCPMRVISVKHWLISWATIFSDSWPNSLVKFLISASMMAQKRSSCLVISLMAVSRSNLRWNLRNLATMVLLKKWLSSRFCSCIIREFSAVILRSRFSKRVCIFR